MRAGTMSNQDFEVDALDTPIPVSRSERELSIATESTKIKFCLLDRLSTLSTKNMVGVTAEIPKTVRAKVIVVGNISYKYFFSEMNVLIIKLFL